MAPLRNVMSAMFPSGFLGLGSIMSARHVLRPRRVSNFAQYIAAVEIQLDARVAIATGNAI